MFWPFSEYVRILVRLRSWYVPSLFHLCSVYDLSTFPLFSSTSDQSQSLWKYHIFPNVVNNESKAASFSVGQRMPKVGHFQLLVSVTLIASVIVWLFQRSACSDFFRDFCVPTMRCNEASGCCESQPSADKLLPKRSSASIVKINSDQGAATLEFFLFGAFAHFDLAVHSNILFQLCQICTIKFIDDDSTDVHCGWRRVWWMPSVIDDGWCN